MIANTLLLVTTLLFGFGQIGRISFGGNYSIYMYEIFYGLLLLSLFAMYSLKPFYAKYKVVKVTGFFLGYMLLSFILSSFIYSQPENLSAFAYLLRLSFYLLGFLYVYHHSTQSKKFSHMIRLVLFVFMGMSLITAFGQYMLYPDLRNLFYLGWDPHLSRMFGTFLEPVILGSIFTLLGLILIFHRIIENIFVSSLLGFILGVGVLLSFSRGVFVAVIATAFFYLYKTRYKLFISLVVIFAFGLFLIPKPAGEGVNLLRTATIESRIKDYTQAFEIWKKRALFGIGYNHIQYEKIQEKTMVQKNFAQSSFHSSFLIVLVTGGIFGLLLFIWLLVEWSKLNMFAFFATIFLSIASLFDNVLLHPFILFLFTLGVSLKFTHPSRE